MSDYYVIMNIGCYFPLTWSCLGRVRFVGNGWYRICFLVLDVYHDSLRIWKNQKWRDKLIASTKRVFLESLTQWYLVDFPMYEQQGAWFAWQILQAVLSLKDWESKTSKSWLLPSFFHTSNFWKEIVCFDLDVGLSVGEPSGSLTWGALCASGSHRFRMCRKTMQRRRHFHRIYVILCPHLHKQHILEEHRLNLILFTL